MRFSEAVEVQIASIKHKNQSRDMLEIERDKLCKLALQYGLSSPIVLGQSRIVDRIIFKMMK